MKKGCKTSIRMDTEEKRMLEVLCEREDRSMGDMIRQLIKKEYTKIQEEKR